MCSNVWQLRVALGDLALDSLSTHSVENGFSDV